MSPSSNVILVIGLLLQNELPIEVTVFGILMLVNPHLSNALLPIDVAPLRFICSRDEQPANVNYSIVHPVPSVTLDKLVQLLNEACLNKQLDGIIMDYRAVQPLNPPPITFDLPIRETEFGIVIDFNVSFPTNHVGISCIDVKYLNSSKYYIPLLTKLSSSPVTAAKSSKVHPTPSELYLLTHTLIATGSTNL
jgi:hypothetical protein